MTHEIPGQEPINHERREEDVVPVRLSRNEREILNYIKNLSGIESDEDILRDGLFPSAFVNGEITRNATVYGSKENDTDVVYDPRFSMVARHILAKQEEAQEREKLKSFSPPPDSSIDILDLPAYVHNKLMKKGINTIQALKNEDTRRLRAIGLADGSLTKINEALAKISQDNPRDSG